MIGRLINPKIHTAFTPVPDWLAERTELSALAKLAFARLARFYNVDEEYAYPDMKRIERELGAGERQVRTAIRELEAVGLITSRRRGLGMSNVYQFHDHPWRSDNVVIRPAESAALDLHMPAALDLHMPADPSLKREQSRENSQERSLLAAAENPRQERKAEHRINTLWHEVMGDSVPRRPLSPVQVREVLEAETLAMERGLDPGLLRQTMEDTARTGVASNPWLWFLNAYRGRVDGNDYRTQAQPAPTTPASWLDGYDREGRLERWMQRTNGDAANG